MNKYFKNKEKITKAFLAKRDSKPREFWCHTQEASEFYAYWDKKWEAIQRHFNREWLKISETQ